MRVHYRELHCGGGEGVAADGDHMIRGAGVHVALDLEPDVVGGSGEGGEGGDVQTLPNTTEQGTEQCIHVRSILFIHCVIHTIVCMNNALPLYTCTVTMQHACSSTLRTLLYVYSYN